MEISKGRPRIYTVQDDPMKVTSIRMTLWHERMAKKLGDGSISEGVRFALEMASGQNVRKEQE